MGFNSGFKGFNITTVMIKQLKGRGRCRGSTYDVFKRIVLRDENS